MMTESEARQVAIDRWGRYGFARRDGLVCKVGTIGAPIAHRAYGAGGTWEEAFAYADVDMARDYEEPTASGEAK